MAHYMVEVPDGTGFHEIYTPIKDGIRSAVTCDECRKSIRVPSMTYGNHHPVLYCNMFGVTVEPWRFCSWGEGNGQAMEDLKPCPFCGGDAEIRYEPSPGVYYVHCDACGSETGNTGLYPEREKAIGAWNGRAERTCRIENRDCGDGVTGTYCSECGNHADEDDCYCPTCGARVVG